jgi:DNA helicase-2/ATP-dependent DNA helicase PcrA
LCGLDDAELYRVQAAFHYVRSNETVQPADLLDADGLRTLIAGPA